MSATMASLSLPLSAPRRGRVIAIASGKGGVGKTWLAITLAQALSRAGRRVLLFDGDLGLANVDVQLGLSPALDLGAVLAGRADLPQAAIHLPTTGFDVLAGRSGSGSLAGLEGPALEAALALLPDAARRWEEVVVDLGAGLDTPTRRMAAAADLLLVVATDEPTSLTDAYAVLKLHHQDAPGSDARIVVNLAADATAGRRTYETLAQAARRFLRREVPLAGIIRRDPRVREAIRSQTPLLTRHPTTAAAVDVERLAADLLATPAFGRR
jgi:flagellar biosynthesis protein FlhG